ncbi:D-glycero-beta-D-manno-heptose 1,7-bisphosphate 7-phosphatase [soil metagenome]
MSHNLKLIVLDRDGTINIDRDDYVKSASEWEPIPGALEAIARLNHAGWRTVIATNQSAIGRGIFDMSTLNEMHAKMNSLLFKLGGRIDAIFFCPHAPSDGCDCRKPKPGLFKQIGERFSVDMTQVPMVGDSLRDLQAGAAVGSPLHLVRTGKFGGMTDAATTEALKLLPPLEIHDDLSEFAEFIISRERALREPTGTPDSEY